MFNMNVSIIPYPPSVSCAAPRVPAPSSRARAPPLLSAAPPPRQAAHVERYISYKFMYMRAAPPPPLPPLLKERKKESKIRDQEGMGLGDDGAPTVRTISQCTACSNLHLSLSLFQVRKWIQQRSSVGSTFLRQCFDLARAHPVRPRELVGIGRNGMAWCTYEPSFRLALCHFT